MYGIWRIAPSPSRLRAEKSRPLLYSFIIKIKLTKGIGKSQTITAEVNYSLLESFDVVHDLGVVGAMLY